MLTHRMIGVGPLSATLAKHQTCNGSTYDAFLFITMHVH